MHTRKSKVEYKTVSVPEEQYNLIKDWIDSGDSPFVSVDEAYRDGIRNILFGRVKQASE